MMKAASLVFRGCVRGCGSPSREHILWHVRSFSAGFCCQRQEAGLSERKHLPCQAPLLCFVFAGVREVPCPLPHFHPLPIPKVSIRRARRAPASLSLCPPELLCLPAVQWPAPPTVSHVNRLPRAPSSDPGVKIGVIPNGPA